MRWRRKTGDLNLVAVDYPVVFQDAPDAELRVHGYGLDLRNDGQDGLQVFDVTRHVVQLSGQIL